MDPDHITEGPSNAMGAADVPVPDTPTVTNTPPLLDATGGWMRTRYPHGLFLAITALAVLAGAAFAVRYGFAAGHVYHAVAVCNVYVHSGKPCAIRAVATIVRAVHRVYVHA